MPAATKTKKPATTTRRAPVPSARAAAPAPRRASAQDIICVRIKRYNPKRGHKMQRYMVFGYKFLEENNWYKVPATITYLGQKKDLREYLENVRQDNEDPESPMAFDVCTVAEMQRINQREREIEERKQYNLRRTGDPVDMTRSSRRDSERGDLTLDDINYSAGRRKFPRSMRSAAEEES